ncbi:RNA methyltransferase [Candidatus Methylospira mobilis]|uniref:tRNA (cytidine/uridine-2'-O-)-methyltransferase TrmJ n=1 Tax=Candidatus Methylospira mobilis TaxID=1808979 RepID=A0A5Q0BLQ0_9GAMM|nr:RNA methyltransferase [Candidatus Methylospira mobilis]QFY44763.1 RNA methyltransferase [Candidatus Methylospira mobilis]WNV05697.1 RNA methyltransferase [Candidatus Methylospira mobilis]
MLGNIRIVMVATSHPGNIGAAARAMKNMGLHDLALVTPKLFPHEEADARAAGADDILKAARVFNTLDDAIQDRHRVIGASARLRTIRWPQLTPRECAASIAEGGSALKSAIVFGREHAGLTNEELERCHYLLNIPCNPDFSSLNVAAALQVVSYELFQTSLGAPLQTLESDIEPATGEEMESFHGHLIQTLFDIGFLHERKTSPALTRRLRRIFNRAALEKTDINILRGILTAVQIRTRMGKPPTP